MHRTIEDDARHRLFFKGYRIHSGKVWYIENDDPDNYQENLIGPTDGSYLRVWKALETRSWPTRQAWGELYA